MVLEDVVAGAKFYRFSFLNKLSLRDWYNDRKIFSIFYKTLNLIFVIHSSVGKISLFLFISGFHVSSFPMIYTRLIWIYTFICDFCFFLNHHTLRIIISGVNHCIIYVCRAGEISRDFQHQRSLFLLLAYWPFHQFSIVLIFKI